MALPILDGNQSATTLSTILSSGQHITAHTVVSLGTQAITDIASAVSGTSVCIGAISISGTPSVTGSVSVLNFPASQSTTFGAVTGSVSVLNFPASQAVTFSAVSISNLPSTQTIAGTVTVGTLPSIANNTDFVVVGENLAEGFNNYGVFGVSVSNLYTATQTIAGSVTLGAGTAQIGSVTASISNSVTIASLPAISGTVTANAFGLDQGDGTSSPKIPIISFDTAIEAGNSGYVVPVQISNTAGAIGASNALPISGTVTVGNSVTISSLPAISGTVTANTFAVQGTAVTTSNFTSTTASTVLASYNATREVLTIFNEGAGNLHICAGATCTTIAYQVRLSAGDYYEVPNHQTTITHSAVFATAGTARVTQVS